MSTSYRSRAKEPHVDLRISIPQSLAARFEFALSTVGTHRGPPHGAKSAIIRKLLERWLDGLPPERTTPTIGDL